MKGILPFYQLSIFTHDLPSLLSFSPLGHPELILSLETQSFPLSSKTVPEGQPLLFIQDFPSASNI